MHKIKSYISVLMLVLLLFPMAEKVIHEIGHFDDEHCDVQETHFCPVEHNCSICDYIFSSSTAINPNEQEQVIPFVQHVENKTFGITFNTTTSQKYTLPLRGPPVA